MKKTYKFSQQEREFVQGRLAQADTLMTEVRGLLSFVAAREKLQGSWDLLPDRSGIFMEEKEKPNA